MPRLPEPQYLYGPPANSITLACSVHRERHRAVERWADRWGWQLHNLWRFIIAAGMDAFRQAPAREDEVGTHDPCENLEREDD